MKKVGIIMGSDSDLPIVQKAIDQLAALEIPCQLVTPRTWKGEFGLNGSKDRSIEVCKRLFPGVYLLPSSKCRKESDGMAEAILIAEYARRKF